MRRIEYPISAEYCRNWTMADALREIIANAKDEGNYQLSYDSSTKGCYITNVGSKIKPKHLVLGNSSKSATQIGQFGEGMKIAALVAARTGRKFYVSTNEFSFRPILEWKEELESEILILELEASTKVKEETMVFVECSKEEYNEAKGLFLNWSKCKPLNAETPRVMLPGGKLFVNGLFTMAIYSSFSYNIDSKEFINRDRTVVNLEAAKKEIEQILEREAFGSKKFCEMYLKDGLTADEPKLESTLRLYSTDSRFLRQALNKMLGNPEKIAISDGSEADLVLRDAGYMIMKPVKNWAFKCTLRIMLNIKESAEELKANPPESVDKQNIVLKSIEAKAIFENLDKAVAIACKVMKVEDIGEVKVITEFSDNVLTKGEYNPGEDIIYIHSNIVEEGGATLLGVLIHEAIHKLRGVNDRTREFENIMTDLIGELANELY